MAYTPKNYLNFVREEGKKKKFVDERIYVPKHNENDISEALIRFLPPVSEDKTPVVKAMSHYFHCVDNSWFIENCPRSIGQKCPVCEYGFANYKEGTKSPFIATTKFYANIYVVRDPLTPSNEGKVFILRFGKDILNLINTQIGSESMVSEPVNIFDPAEGADFILTSKLTPLAGIKNKVPVYRESKFLAPSPIHDKDGRPLSPEALQAVMAGLHNIYEFTDPSKFKSYEELDHKFKTAMHILTASPAYPETTPSPAPVPPVLGGATLPPPPPPVPPVAPAPRTANEFVSGMDDSFDPSLFQQGSDPELPF